MTMPKPSMSTSTAMNRTGIGERRIATEHLALLPAGDWEGMALRRVNDLCAETPPRSLSSAILVTAEAAAKRAHTMGAFAFYRTAHRLAMQARAWDEAS